MQKTKAQKEEQKDIKPKTLVGKDKEQIADKGLKIIVLARSGYGKTVFTSKLVIDLVKKNIVDPNHVVIFSKDFKSDPSQKDMIEYCAKHYKGSKEALKQTAVDGQPQLPKGGGFITQNCSEKINLEFLQKLFDQQKSLKERQVKDKINRKKVKPLPIWLLYFDDQASEASLKQQDGILVDIAIRGRKYGIITIYLVQQYTGVINPMSRNQTTNMCIGQINEGYYVDDILKRYSGIAEDMTGKQMLQFMRQSYSEAMDSDDGHGFLNINTEKSFGQGRLQQNFDDIYFDIQ